MHEGRRHFRCLERFEPVILPSSFTERRCHLSAISTGWTAAGRAHLGYPSLRQWHTCGHSLWLRRGPSVPVDRWYLRGGAGVDILVKLEQRCGQCGGYSFNHSGHQWRSFHH